MRRRVAVAAARRGEALRQEFSFICVPIVLYRAAASALAVDLRFKPERDFDSSVKFFGIRTRYRWRLDRSLGRAARCQT